MAGNLAVNISRDSTLSMEIDEMNRSHDIAHRWCSEVVHCRYCEVRHRLQLAGRRRHRGRTPGRHAHVHGDTTAAARPCSRSALLRLLSDLVPTSRRA